jgi:hypothetical protein
MKKEGFWHLFKKELFEQHYDVTEKEYSFLLDSLRFQDKVIYQLLYTEEPLLEETYKRLNEIKHNEFGMVI